MAVLFTVLLGISASVLGYFSYYFNRGYYIQGAGTVIETEIRYLQEADQRQNLLATIESISIQPDRVYLLSDPLQKYIGGNLEKIPDDVDVLTEGTIVFTHEHKKYAARIYTFPDMRTLLVGMDITDAAASYKIMQSLSLLSIALMAVVILVSFIISTFVVSRTNRIAMTAKSIMDTGDLSKRIIVDARWDDLSNMAYVLNAFLDRVEELMQGIRRVSDNIAHDLRTPLTRLLNHLEALRDQDCIVADAKALDACDSMIGETHRLLDTFNALLRISRIETGRQRQNFTMLDWRPIILDVIELYEPLAEEKGVLITHDVEGLMWQGDRDLLFQVFANLLDNALKFTSPGGAVKLTLSGQGGHPVFSIKDSGPGIDPADRERVFDRFYRADSSRTTEGNGLGLSLVAVIVSLHGGKITLKDAAPGLIVEIIF